MGQGGNALYLAIEVRRGIESVDEGLAVYRR